MFLLSLPVLENVALVVSVVHLIVMLWLIKFTFNNWKRLNNLKVFGILSIISLMQTVSAQVLYPIFFYNLKTPINYFKSLYVCIEFVLMLIYFYHLITCYKTKKIVKVIIVLSSLATLSITVYRVEILKQNYELLTLFESLTLLTLSLIGYSQLLATEILFDLKKSPEFYSITAIFFLFSFTLPFFLFENYLYKYYSKTFIDVLINIVSLTFYTTFFFLIIIAMKWKIRYQN